MTPPVVTLHTARPIRRREDFTLFQDKVRVEWRRPFASGMTEIPLRFLDPTWGAQRGSGKAGALAFCGVATLAYGAGAAGMVASMGWQEAWGAVLGFGAVWALLAPLSFLAWWNSRFDVVAFTSLHPQYGPLVIQRTRERELEVLQFADSVSERIRLLAMTKPDG